MDSARLCFTIILPGLPLSGRLEKYPEETCQFCKFSSEFAAAAAKWLQSCPTLCAPTDGSPPGSPVPGILQARTLEWVAISFSNEWKWSHSVVSDSATPWTAAHQAPPSMGFSRPEYWSGVPLPSPLVSLGRVKYEGVNYILWLPRWLSGKKSTC